jgi:hypothetical protein
MGGDVDPPLTPTGSIRLVNCNLDVPTDIEVRRNNFFKSLGWESPTRRHNWLAHSKEWLRDENGSTWTV